MEKEKQEDFVIFKPENPSLNFCDDGVWMMRITRGKIIFNREQFPDLCEDEFAYRILKILENTKLIALDESQWDKKKIIFED